MAHGRIPESLPSSGRVVLVVEDEVLIAMDLELLLQRHGWRVLGPAATVAEALRLLAGERPNVALLDVNLRGELVTPVAEELRVQSVPFVLTTAYDSRGLAFITALAKAPTRQANRRAMFTHGLGTSPRALIRGEALLYQ